MADQIPIGTDDEGVGVYLETDVLVDTRVLVQGNSGAGKSRILRRLAEQTAGQVQTIILDPEGEFSTLRSHFDFVLAGKGGEVPTHPATAGALARKLMELRTSAVVDLYDLRLPDRRAFVAAFLDALLDVPKSLYGSVLVMIDEAHLFCPEGEHVESRDAVIALMCQGRKRGMCGVLATQRLSKLDKDAAAECNNVLIGRTQLDTDQKRAANALGISAAQAVALRDLDKGHFRGFGPAFVATGRRGIVDFLGGEVVTMHPRAGERKNMKPPAPPAAILKFAAQLSEIPAEVAAQEGHAAERDRQLVTAHGRVDELGANLVEAQQRIEALVRELETAQGRARVAVPEVELARLTNCLEAFDQSLRPALVGVVERLDFAVAGARALVEGLERARLDTVALPFDHGILHVDVSKPHKPDVVARVVQDRVVITGTVATISPNIRVDTAEKSDGPQRILNMIATLNGRGIEVDRDSVARWLGLHPRGGRYGEWIKDLRADGRLEDDSLRLSARGSAAARRAVAPGLTALLDHLVAIGEGGPGRVLGAIVAAKHGGIPSLTREALAERLDLHPRGGRYGEWLKYLREARVITQRGDIAALPGVWK